MSEQSPLVSFVLPTKNSMPHVRRTVEAVLDQGYDNYELVVQDGVSTDGTLDYFRQMASNSVGDRLRLRSEPDSGIGQAYNRGLQRSRGDLIWFLASDEQLQPNALDRALTWY